MPVVEREGILSIGNELPCYVLSNEERVVKFSKLIYALRGVENGKIGNYLDTKNIKKYLPKELYPIKDSKNDRVPQRIIYFIRNGKLEKGYNCNDFITICKAFVNAWINDDKLSDVQKIMAYNSNKFVMAASKVGIEALIDEVTQYRIYKKVIVLESGVKNKLSNPYREWNNIFPLELWYQIYRLSYDKVEKEIDEDYLIKTIDELIYSKLDKDILEYLRLNSPLYKSGSKYLTWVSEEERVRELINRIWQIIGMAQTCNTISQLKKIVNREFC